MGYSSIMEDMIENKLLSLHTAYVAKVLSYSGGKAKIQPLNMVKAYGSKAQKQDPLSGVPVINSARYKLSTKTIYYVDHEGKEQSTQVVTARSLQAGDIVFCGCAERDISSAKNGDISTPSIGHHSMSDSVVLGIL